MDESFSKAVIKAITKEAKGDIDVIKGAQGINGVAQGLILTDDFGIAEKWERKMPAVYMCKKKADENLNDLLNTRNEDRAGKILHIYKYSKVGRLINACAMWNKNYCEENVFRPDVANVRENIYKMVVVCSAQGGTGCSSFARLMAKRFAGEQKRVLLIGFDNIEPSEESVAEDEHTHREFIYKILNKRSNAGLDVMDYVSLHDGVYSFTKGSGINPLIHLDKDEIMRYIEGITNYNDFDVIVVDLGVDMTERGLALMDLADEICIMHPRDERFIKSYMNCISIVLGEGIASKIRFIK
ncbi:hypothetical protein GCWU000322_00582 [Eubacterium saphenum ATCC 49989]|nr:hypothetical protein GCWU000322_00582 [Eubacterium saphenum ATCC 49989]